LTSRRLSSFVDALTAGRRPVGFRADPQDTEVLQAAIALRAARPGDSMPDQQFVADLFEDLADRAASRSGLTTPSVKAHQRRMALAALAASVVLIGGTVMATDAANHPAGTPTAMSEPNGNALRTATFETADRQVRGQIVAYHGHQSWVYMNVDVPNYNGPIVCNLQVDNGSVVATGAFVIHGGTGQWTRTVQIDVNRLRAAKLVTPNDTVVASATFT
jgi:hypothetical protein